MALSSDEEFVEVKQYKVGIERLGNLLRNPNGSAVQPRMCDYAVSTWRPRAESQNIRSRRYTTFQC
jgi:hypothetical protein